MPTSTSTITCHHIQTNDQPCGSPALRGEQFCFYHHPTRRPPRPRGRKPRLPAFRLPSLQDRPSIQRGLAKVISRVNSGRLDHTQARFLVGGLQFINQNLPGDHRQLSALIQQAQISLKIYATRSQRSGQKNVRSPAVTRYTPVIYMK
jgi:hypothetical protein